MLSRIEWLYHLPGVERLLRLHWERLGDLFTGEKLAVGALWAVTTVELVVAVNRFMAMEFVIKPRKAVKTPKRKKGFGLKVVALALLALLPGGLVGTFVVYNIMGKDNWRRDAFWIVGLSLPVALIMFLLRASFFPWPQWSDSIYIVGALGLVFGILQVWAMVKLLREWWGEPDECIAWWPPAALWCQAACALAVAWRILALSS